METTLSLLSTPTDYNLQKSRNVPPPDLMLRQACFVGCKSHKWVSYEKGLLALEPLSDVCWQKILANPEAVRFARAAHNNPEDGPNDFTISIPWEYSELSGATWKKRLQGMCKSADVPQFVSLAVLRLLPHQMLVCELLCHCQQMDEVKTATFVRPV